MNLHNHLSLDTAKEGMTAEATALRIAEYQALREEVIKRLEFMYQINALALVAPGAISAFGISTSNALLFFIYPILAFILAVLWSQHDRRCREIGYYICTCIEPHFDMYGLKHGGWEHYMQRTRTKHKRFDLDSVWAALGIFVGTEVLAIGIGIQTAWHTGTLFLPINVIFGVFALLAMVSTAYRLLASYHHEDRIQKFIEEQAIMNSKRCVHV